jgi:hypothetical protein
VLSWITARPLQSVEHAVTDWAMMKAALVAVAVGLADGADATSV